MGSFAYELLTAASLKQRISNSSLSFSMYNSKVDIHIRDW